MLKLHIVPSRVPRTKLSFLIPCPPIRFNGGQSRSFSGFLGKGMWLRGFASIKDSPSPPISTESLQTSESHLQDPLEGVPEIQTLNNEIVSINAEISKCAKEISENKLNLKNVESELSVLFSARIADPGAEQKRDRLEEAMKYYRTNDTQLKGFQLSLREDKAKKEAELVNLKTALKSKMKISWRDDLAAEETALVRERSLFFVNRERAALQLFDIHNGTLARAVRGEGEDWEVGLCANDYGGGESKFASNYISLISKLEVPIARHQRVFSYLQNAVTIQIRLGAQSKPAWDLSAQLVTHIKEAVTRKAAHKFDFDSFPQTLLPFMQELV